MNHCRKRNLCNYCKKPGHIILDCRLRKSRHGDRAPYDGSPADRGQSSGNRSGAAYSSTMSETPNPTSIDQLVQEALQRILPSALTTAFSTVGISGSSDQEPDRNGKQTGTDFSS
ncbi:hypothetical protein LINPERHAP1_LOCUS2592 [Linum perenne]